MGLSRIIELETLMNRDFHGARRDDGKKIICRILEFFGVPRVAHQGRAREIERAFGAENSRLEWRHSATGIAEAHHHPAHGEAIERPGKRIFADGIIDDRYAGALRDLADAADPVVLARVEDMIAA